MAPRQWEGYGCFCSGVAFCGIRDEREGNWGKAEKDIEIQPFPWYNEKRKDVLSFGESNAFTERDLANGRML